MNTALQTRTKAPAESSFTPAHAGLLQRKCACGGPAGLARECEECSGEQLSAQRASMGVAASLALSPPAAGALGRYAETPEPAARLSPPRFGHDFGRVRLRRAGPGTIQTKLTVGRPGDEYEEEADRVAERVMRMPDDGAAAEEVEDEKTLEILRIICPDCEEGEPVQAKEASGQLSAVDPGLESRIEDVKGGGQPLPESVRAFFEPRFGYDFSHVRIHTDGAAAETAEQLGALAYTVGSHIAFNQGQFAPDSPAGRKLLAHELTHVVQQAPASRRVEMKAAPARGHWADGPGASYEAAAAVRGGAPTRVSKQAGPEQIHLHTKEDCDEAYEECSEGCRRLPRNAKRRRALCWAACMAAYATCLASSEEVLTFAALVAAIVLIAADGPFPIGDAAAAALLISLGITGSSGSQGSQ